MAILNSCCFCCTTRTGTLILGISSLIGAIIGTCAMILFFISWGMIKEEIIDMHNKDPKLAHEDIDMTINVLLGIGIFFLVLFVLHVLIASLLIHGVRKMIAGMLIPYLVFMVLGLIFMIISAVLGIVYAKQTVVGIVGMVLDILLSIYFFLVVLSHYQELRDRQGRIGVPTDSKF